LKNISRYKESLKTIGKHTNPSYPPKQDSSYLKVGYKKLFELSPLGIIVLDMNGVVRECNPAAYGEAGYSEEDYIGKHFSEIITVRDGNVTENSKLFTSIKNGQAIKPFEWKYRRKDGTTGYAEVHTSLLEDKGKKLGILVIKKDITELKKWENSIQESENKFRDLLDNTNDLIQSVTPDGRFRYVNNAWKKALGYNEKEISGLKVFDVIHPDYLQHYEKVFQGLLSGETVGRLETAFVSKIGSVIIVEGNMNVRFEDGKPVYTRSTFRDITKNKNLEENIIRLTNALSMSTDCILITDLKAKIVDVSEKTLEICGVNKKEELVGRHFLELVAQEERAQASMDVKEIVEKGYLTGREYNLISRRGMNIPVRMTASIIRDADNNPIGLVRVGRPLVEVNAI
jgi:PAS domain S-box-containing protein